jgi:hypothetical protein
LRKCGLLRSGKAQQQKAPTQQKNGQRGMTHATLTRTLVPRFKHGRNYTWVLDASIIANALIEPCKQSSFRVRGV